MCSTALRQRIKNQKDYPSLPLTRWLWACLPPGSRLSDAEHPPRALEQLAAREMVVNEIVFQVVQCLCSSQNRSQKGNEKRRNPSPGGTRKYSKGTPSGEMKLKSSKTENAINITIDIIVIIDQYSKH